MIAVKPAPEIPNDVARALHLSDSPDLRHIGYWRDTEDGSDGYAHQALASSRKDLVSFLETGKPPYYTFETVDEPYLRQRVEAAMLALEFSKGMPWPGDHLDPSMDESEKGHITRALFDLNEHVTIRYASPSWDRLDWPSDDSPPWKCLSWANTMGTGEVVHQGWVWPEGLFRYVQRHRLVLPQAFLHDVGIVGS